jgi:hypothetical protein
MTEYVLKIIYNIFLLMAFTVRYKLSHFPFLFFRRFTFLGVFSFFLVKLSTPYEFFMVCSILVSFHQRPQRPGRPPRGPPLVPPLGGAVCTGPGWPPLVLWLPRPLRCWPRGWVFPRRFAGSWPDSHSGGGTNFGVGGGAGWADFAAGGGAVLTGITDSSLALLVTGSCVSPPPAMRAISFVAATLVAFEVRCTPSPV